MKISHIYLIKHPSGATKIGRADSPQQRLTALSTATPDRLEILAIYKVGKSNVDAVEKYLHQLFASKRIKGEWFAINEIDIATIGALLAYEQWDIDAYRAVGREGNGRSELAPRSLNRMGTESKRKCLECGRDFIGVSRQRFCSGACKSKTKRRRKAYALFRNQVLEEGAISPSAQP